MPAQTIPSAGASPPRSSAERVAQVRAVLAESIRVKERVAGQCGEQIADAGGLLVECFGRGGRALLFGNGGSAADAQHIAGEWVGRYRGARPALDALALTANSSDLTAIANDSGFAEVFARQIEAHGRAGDIAIAISTSGASPNVLRGVEVARERSLTTLALSGKGGGELASRVDLAIVVPADDTPRIQESHIAIGHVLCEIVETELFGVS